MTQEKISQLERKLDDVLEYIKSSKDQEHHLLTIARDSVPDSLSQILTGFDKRLEALETKLDPIAKAFEKASGFKATLFLIASTVASLVAIVEGYRRLK